MVSAFPSEPLLWNISFAMESCGVLVYAVDYQLNYVKIYCNGYGAFVDYLRVCCFFSCCIV